MGQYDWLRTLPIFAYPDAPIARPPKHRIPPSAITARPETAYDKERKAHPIVIYDAVSKNKRFIDRNRRLHTYDAIDRGVYSARSYSPRLSVLAANPKPGDLLMGIELELLSPRDASNAFIGMRTATQKLLNHKVILVTDGSLHGEGAEINSIPMSESAYRASRHTWHKYLNLLAKQYRYTTSHKCGLHLHINSNFMPEQNWAYLQSWLCVPDIAEFFMRISGRHPDIGNGFRYCIFKVDRDKYRALNCTYDFGGSPTPTREFRFFAGTAKPALFFNSIETCLLLAKWGALASHNLPNYGVLSFLDFCAARSDYPNTSHWLHSEFERLQHDNSYRLEIVPDVMPPQYSKPDLYTMGDNDLRISLGLLPHTLQVNTALYARVRRAIHRALHRTPYWAISPAPSGVGYWSNVEIVFKGFWDKRILSPRYPSYIRVWSENEYTHTHRIVLTRYRGGWGNSARLDYNFE